MEEKERYEVISNKKNFIEIQDIESNVDTFITEDTIEDLLNQQDKRIKEFEEENGYILFEDGYDKDGNEIHKQVYTTYKEEFTRLVLENKKLRKENQQLKQQLHDLPKKIVEEIKLQLFNHFKVKNIEEYEKLPLIDSLFTADTVIEILDTILKKFGGKDE